MANILQAPLENDAAARDTDKREGTTLFLFFFVTPAYTTDFYFYNELFFPLPKTKQVVSASVSLPSSSFYFLIQSIFNTLYIIWGVYVRCSISVLMIDVLIAWIRRGRHFRTVSTAP